MKATALCIASWITACGCAYPRCVLRVDQWTRQDVDGIPYLAATVHRDEGIERILDDYGRRVRLQLGRDDAIPAYCMIGYFDADVTREAPVAWFRLDVQPEVVAEVLGRSQNTLKLVVQWAYSFDVLATCAIAEGVLPRSGGAAN